MAGAPIPSADCFDGTCDATLATTGLCLADGTPIAVITTRNCVTGIITEDGWIDLTTGIFSPGLPPGGTSSCASDNYEFELTGWLCDVLPDGSVAGIALVQIERDASGAVIGITLIGVDGLPYVPVGTMMRCPDDQVSAEILCDAGNAGFPFVRFYFYSASGIIPSRDTDLDGNPYLIVGAALKCVDQVAIENWRDDAEYLVLCDDAPRADVEFLRRYDVSSSGGVTVTDTELDGVTPYVLIGNAIVCPSSVTVTNQFDDEYAVLCDTVTTFLRRYRTDSAGTVTVANFTLAGAAYVPVGAVGSCSSVVSNFRDDEYVVLCDTVTSFLRQFRTDAAGAITVTNLTLAGAAYVPVGAVTVCAATISGTVTVAPLASQNVRTYRNNLVGVGVWSIAINGHGGKVKSLTFRRRAGGAVGSVTITDNFGTVTVLQAGESETWSITALDDEIISPMLVTTTAAANDVIILWTEAP